MLSVIIWAEPPTHLDFRVGLVTTVTCPMETDFGGQWATKTILRMRNNIYNSQQRMWHAGNAKFTVVTPRG